MKNFFKRLFGGTTNKKPLTRRQALRLWVESLEARDNPSHGFLGLGGFGGFGPAQFGAFQAGGESHGEHDQTTLTATLTGVTGTSGSVTFTSNADAGTNNLNVQVSGLAANTQFSVLSGTTSLGTITTDANGSGSLSVSNITTALASGAAITVTDPTNATVLSGTLASGSDEGNGGGDCHHDNQQTLAATLTGAAGTSGTATATVNNNAGTNNVNVQVAGLTASTKYTVMSGTSTLGTITTDANGAGKLTASNVTANLASGSPISVVDATNATVLSGTLAVSNPADAITHLTSSLTGTTGSGTLNYSANANTGTNNLSVSVTGLTPSTQYNVLSGTNTLGSIMTNASGSGSLVATNVSPALASGGSVSVVDPSNATVLSGTLSTGTTPVSTGTHLVANLTGTTGSGKAHFHASASTSNNHFAISLTGLTANATYTIQVNGVTLGTITTNANGSGRLSLSNIANSIASGAAVTVLDSTGATVLSGTFATAVTHHGHRHHH